MFVFRILYFSVCVCLIKCELETYRLCPVAAHPIHYSLKIEPNFEKDNFFGEVSIVVRTQRDLDGIILHSSNLTISEVTINQKTACYKELQYQKLKVFYQNENIQPGEHIINIKYIGLIAKNNGFIRATFGNEDNEVYIFVTDLEPTYARTVFPCFDEPSFKAKFNIRLISPNNTFRAISNMPEIKRFNTTNESNVYDFTTSVRMSTYLLSFAFTDTKYTYYEKNFEHNGKIIPIRIHTVNASEANNNFAFQCAASALKFYSEYTNISYPMQKLDMIEYRRNLTAATENWGLITFREGLLTPSLGFYNRYQVKLVMFHELGHFWFGNLVTNDWWMDLWLQEGFATYMSYKLLAKDSTKNKTVVDEMRTFSFNDYFETDITTNTPAIVTYLDKPEKIETVFNDIVYYKSAAILYMLEDLIGEETFQTIIRKFLKKHAYCTVTTNDFIALLEQVVKDEPLRDFVESYLFQKKFPVISVDILENSTYVFTQSPSVIISATEESVNNGEKWSIPVTYLTDSGNISRFWFDKVEDNVKLQIPDAKWVIFNPSGMAIYRMELSNKLWDQLIDNFAEMPVSVTESILLDVFYSFRTRKINCHVYMRLMNRVKKVDRGKWIYFHSMLEHLKDHLICQNHKNEASILWKFFQRRLEETGYGRRAPFIEAECNSKYVNEEEGYKKHIDTCAQWIREHIKEKDSNVIPPL